MIRLTWDRSRRFAAQHAGEALLACICRSVVEDASVTPEQKLPSADTEGTRRWNIARRGFLRQIGVALAGIIVRRPAIAAVSAVAAPVSAAVAASGAELYLTPRYLPPGYRLITKYTNRNDGFGGGPTEIALWYKNPNHPKGGSRPLMIFQAPAPRTEFFATAGHGAELQTITLASGQIVQADYHDGMWGHPPERGAVRPWLTTDAHSLSFRAGTGPMIAIRGWRRAGVTRDELVRVASSLA